MAESHLDQGLGGEGLRLDALQARMAGMDSGEIRCQPQQMVFSLQSFRPPEPRPVHTEGNIVLVRPMDPSCSVRICPLCSSATLRLLWTTLINHSWVLHYTILMTRPAFGHRLSGVSNDAGRKGSDCHRSRAKSEPCKPSTAVEDLVCTSLKCLFFCVRGPKMCSGEDETWQG